MKPKFDVYPTRANILLNRKINHKTQIKKPLKLIKSNEIYSTAAQRKVANEEIAEWSWSQELSFMIKS